VPEHRRDPVGSFVREVRGTISRTDALLRRIGAERVAAQPRVAKLVSTIAPPAEEAGAEEFLQELELRDEELRSTIEDLQGHVDELERASELLERERMKYFDLFVNAPEAYVSTNEAGIIQDANLATAELLASEPQYLVGRPLITFVARQDTRAFRAHLKMLGERNANGDPRPACQLRMRPRGQAPFPVRLRATVVRAQSAKTIAIRWNLCRIGPNDADAVNDVTDEDIIGPLARNLRGTLATIGGWAQMLREGQLPGAEETHQALEWIEHTASSQREILDQLVETLEAGGAGGAHESADLSEGVLKAVGTVESAEPGRIAVKGLTPAGEVLVHGPPVRLQRVVELLLRRALDGTPRNGTPIVVSVRVAAGAAGLDIEAPETARQPLGWELRTTLVTRIVKEYRGSLVLHDESPSVRLRLPLASPGAGAGEATLSLVGPYPE
jgi:PAS domain-containing protein